MNYPAVPIWKEAPFVRLLVPFIGGILLQWKVEWVAAVYWIVVPVCIAGLALFLCTNSFSRFTYYGLAGLFLQALLLFTGALLTYYKDVRHYPGWIQPGSNISSCMARLEEPLSRKGNAYRAVAVYEWVREGQQCRPATGRVILYFAADTSLRTLTYHSRIIFSKPLQQISNTGNPGGFDYRQYCAFQNIYHQIYLRPGEYRCLPVKEAFSFNGALFRLREMITGILRSHIRKEEAGLAEALLIGYKDDLDKALVQSYANTGVVHIIAISGMHLGLIYWLLVQLFLVFKRLPVLWLAPLLTITCLWVFSLLTGGSASVMRSAVMFTCIVTGRYLGKQSSVYNSLAASAFLLLCYNPFWLWDAGFQLSYLAVLSIVIFMRPLYNLFYVKNRLLDLLVKLFATSLAAQVLTMPVSIYLFHQFPIYFLITNIVAVPLSSLVVLGEIAVCALAWVPWLSGAGWVVSWMIALMNRFVMFMEKLPFSMLGHLQISLVQTALLYVAIAFCSGWLLCKKPLMLLPALCSVLLFTGLRTSSFNAAQRRQAVIVYNVPKHQAMSLVSGRKAILIADGALLANRDLLRANIEPAGTLYRYRQITAVKPASIAVQALFFNGKRILLFNRIPRLLPMQKRIQADLVIISGAPRMSIGDLVESVDCKMLVFDSSNPAWKVELWMAEGKKAGLNCYSVAAKGAFVFKAD